MHSIQIKLCTAILALTMDICRIVYGRYFRPKKSTSKRKRERKREADYDPHNKHCTNTIKSQKLFPSKRPI